MTETLKLATYYSSLTLSDIPEDVQHEAKRLIIDTLGCCVAGASSELGLTVSESLDVFGSGEDASLIGLGKKGALLSACYFNGRFANLMDFDETFPVGIHFGAGAVCSALAICEKYKLTGADLLRATIIGYEFGARVALSIGPMVSIKCGKVEGFPSVWGVAAPVVAASAAAAASALKLTGEGFASALTTAVSNAPLPAGSQWSGAIDLPDTKYCDAGWCTMAGALGAVLAQSGLSSFDSILEAEDGLVKMYGRGAENLEYLSSNIGSAWYLRDITFKQWPTCRFTHNVLTALDRLQSKHSFDIEKIEKIVIETGPLANSERFRQTNPKTFCSRQFSYPHMVGMMLMGIKPGPDWLDSKWDNDSTLSSLKKKIEISLHPRGSEFAEYFQDNQIRQMVGGIRIWQDGFEFIGEAEYASGDPWVNDTYFSNDALENKFIDLVGISRAEGLLPLLRHIDEVEDINLMTSILLSIPPESRAA